jgi:hypothetical protein
MRSAPYRPTNRTFPTKYTILAAFLTLSSAAPCVAQTYPYPYPTQCTQDCSGHSAGYGWAENNEINDESDCSGTSSSFIEGCEQYVRDMEEEESEDEDDSYD